MKVLCRHSLFTLRLMHTNLNYLVQGTSTAAILFLNDHYLRAPITPDEFHA